jgi:predicted lipoprotein with Yx(FWY)xxD motif
MARERKEDNMSESHTGDTGPERSRVILRAVILICVGLAAIAVGHAIRSSGAISSAPAAAHASMLIGRATVKVAYHPVNGPGTGSRAFLVDGRGITLYAFTYDDSGKPACYVDSPYRCSPTWPSCVDDAEYHCVKLWPALTTSGAPRAGAGVNRRLLSVAKRRDGHLQITYNRHPLYYYAGGFGPPPDKKPGDVNGQGFGGLWYVVSPKGLEIK